MSHKKLRPFIVKVSVLGYFPLYTRLRSISNNFLFLIILKHLNIFIINSITKCTHLNYKQYIEKIIEL